MLGLPIQYPLQIYPRTPSPGNIRTTALLLPVNGQSITHNQNRKIRFHAPLPFQMQTCWLLRLSRPGIAIAFLLIYFCVVRTCLAFLPTWNTPAIGSFLWLSLGMTLDLENLITIEDASLGHGVV